MSVHQMPEPDDNARMVPFVGESKILKRDFVEPVPVGTYVALVFRVTGYDADSDGSAMARVEAVDCHGEATGLQARSMGLFANTQVVLDGPGDLHELIPLDADEPL